MVEINPGCLSQQQGPLQYSNLCFKVSSFHIPLLSNTNISLVSMSLKTMLGSKTLTINKKGPVFELVSGPI